VAREDEGKSLDQSKSLEQRVIRSDKGRSYQQIFYIFAFFFAFFPIYLGCSIIDHYFSFFLCFNIFFIIP
jgi:hypothetical protein